MTFVYSSPQAFGGAYLDKAGWAGGTPLEWSVTAVGGAEIATSDMRMESERHSWLADATSCVDIGAGRL